MVLEKVSKIRERVFGVSLNVSPRERDRARATVSVLARCCIVSSVTPSFSDLRRTCYSLLRIYPPHSVVLHPDLGNIRILYVELGVNGRRKLDLCLRPCGGRGRCWRGCTKAAVPGVGDGLMG